MKKFGINFKLVLTSQIISVIGGNTLRFALLLFILDLSQSAGTFGLVTAVSQIPVVLFAIPGGIIADRMNKKKLIVFFDGIKTVICIGLLALFLTGTYSVMNLAVVIAIFVTIVTLFSPILMTAMPTIVDQDVLVEANGAIQSVNAMSELFSFVLGGILVATIGINNIIILAGIAFLISTVIDLFIKIPHVKQEAEFGVIKTASLDMKNSLTFAVKEKPVIIKSALLFALISFLFLPIITVGLPYIARIEFGVNDTMFGISQAIPALGMLLGGVLSGKFKKLLDVKHFSKLVLIMAGLCLALAVTVYGPLFGGAMALPFWLFNVALMLIQVVIMFGNITVISFVQTQVPGNYLGKVLALIVTVASFATPVGQFLFGSLMELFAGRTSILFVVIAALVVGIAVIAKRMFATDINVAHQEVVTST